MRETLQKEWEAKGTIVIFLFFAAWWAYLFFLVSKDNVQYQIFSALYGLLALWGSVWGFSISRKWGGIKSVLGRAIAAFAIGLFLQEFGQIMYSYYAYFLKIVIPYPSLGDVGYFGSIPFYIYGILMLAKASGVKVTLQSMWSKVQAFIIPAVMLIFSYQVFLKEYQFDWNQPLKIFLDFGYPFGQAIYVSIAFLTYLLSRKILGGVMKTRILFILFALVVQYFSDYMYLYQANRGTAYPGGPNDFVYLLSYFLMTLGLLQLKTVFHTLKK